MLVSRVSRPLVRSYVRYSLHVSILARNRGILQELLEEAREAYKAAVEKVISIYAADTYVDSRAPNDA